MERPVPAPRTSVRNQPVKPKVPERSFKHSNSKGDSHDIPHVIETTTSEITAADSLNVPSTSGRDLFAPFPTHKLLNTENSDLSPVTPLISHEKFLESCDKCIKYSNFSLSAPFNQVQDPNQFVEMNHSAPPVPLRNKSSQQLFQKSVDVDAFNSGNDLKKCNTAVICSDNLEVATLVKEGSEGELGVECSAAWKGATSFNGDILKSPAPTSASVSNRPVMHDETTNVMENNDYNDMGNSDSLSQCSMCNSSLDKGLWNPRYMGLDEYRKLVRAADDCFSDFLVKESVMQFSKRVEEDLSLSDSIIRNAESIEQDSSVAEGHSICFSGFIHLILHKKDRGKLWGVLRDSKLSFFRSAEEDESNLLGPYDLKNTLYVGRNPKKASEVELCIRENPMCMHLTLVTDTPQHWVFLIIQCFMPKHDILNQEEDIDAGGIVWIRQGVTCPWVEGWMHVDYRQRRLLYTLDRKVEVFAVDIRKLIAMKSSVMKADWCASIVGSQKGPFMLTWEGCSLYVQAYNDTITSLWAEKLSFEMKKTSNKLEDCKLTKNDIPVLVEKCINFIWQFGLYQPGLYRRNGSMIDARFLMEELKGDPANVYIPPNGEDMVNVVADVLRSFFRQLDSPLIPRNIQSQLFAINRIKDSDRLKKYHDVLMNLPRVRLQTLRRLLGHLKEVAEYAESNSATVENLASIFGPTLFTVEQDENTNNSDFNKILQQIVVLKDLLENYTLIFQESISETRIKNELIKKANPPKPRAEGLLVAIHLGERDSFTFNVQSSLTAEQVSEESRKRPSFSKNDSGVQFALFEVIKSGQLERRVGWKEKMSSMVAGRWIDWDSSGDCYLIFKHDPLPFSYSLRAFAENVKIAAPGTKSFSTCHLKLDISKALIVQCNKSLKEVNFWPVDDLLWFVGHETARKPPFSYTLTFLTLKKGIKYKSKFIGYCLAFSNNTDRLYWLNTVLSAQRDFQSSPSYANVI